MNTTKSKSERLRERLKEQILPEKGAIFDIEYHVGRRSIEYGDEPHNWVNAVSEGLRVVCHGPDFRMSHSRQMKPILPAHFQGPDGAYRRMLRIAVRGDQQGNNADFYIHIMGDLIVVSEKMLKCADLVNQKSLTEKDAALLELMKEAYLKAQEEEKERKQEEARKRQEAAHATG